MTRPRKPRRWNPARTRTTVLSTIGFGCLTASAWTAWGVAPGLASLGLSLLILEALSGKDGT